MSEDITDELRQMARAKAKPQDPAQCPSATPDFSAALLTAKALVALKMEQRPALLGAWMKKGDFGFLFAPRGAGKSWMAMLIGNAIAEGVALGEWQAGECPRAVYYFDAEMNLADVQERARMIGIASDRFHWLSNERLFHTGGSSVNIAEPGHQEALSKMLPNDSVFIIDNLSTAQLGMEENNNDSFDQIRDWLLSLRHRGITVLIVHHAGRNGAMRGSSRREDMAHWIISLKDDSAEDGPAKAFTTSFAKIRNCRATEAPALKWELHTQGAGMTITCKTHSGAEALLAHIRDGIVKNTELASLLNVEPGTVSRWANKLMKAGLVTKDGRDYAAIP
ncbi:MAG TPA: hypothetical protein DCP71_13315 [Verrucomicrobiales bacterium]|nr:hypothetical protein [Verrucomicrobiales bacterium]